MCTLPSAAARFADVAGADRSALQPYNLTAQHPDDFILDLLDPQPALVCQAVANQRRTLKNPPKTVDEYLDTLLKQGLTQTVGVLRQWWRHALSIRSRSKPP